MQHNTSRILDFVVAALFGAGVGFCVKLVGMFLYPVILAKLNWPGGDALDVWAGVPRPGPKQDGGPWTGLGEMLMLFVFIPAVSAVTGALVGGVTGVLGCHARALGAALKLGTGVGAVGMLPGLLIVAAVCAQHRGPFFPVGVLPVVVLGLAAGVGGALSGWFIGMPTRGVVTNTPGQ